MLARSIETVTVQLLAVMMLLIAAQRVQAQQLPTVAPAFQKVDLPGVPSRTTASAFFRDSRGILWVGTEQGLVRYDGYSTQIYAHDPADANTLSNHVIYDIVEGPSGDIWIATRNGLNRIAPDTGQVTRYFVDDRIVRAPSDAFASDLYLDSQNQLWVSTEVNLKRYDPEQDRFIDYQPWDSDFPFIAGPGALKVLSVASGVYWLGTFDRGLIRFVPETMTYRRVALSADESSRGGLNRVREMLALDERRLLLGTQAGLAVFDTADDSVRSILQDEVPGAIHGLAVDNDGQYWVLAGRHVYRVAASLDRVVRYTGTPGLGVDWDESMPRALFVDAEDNVWLGIDDSGIHKLSGLAGRVRRVALAGDGLAASSVHVTSLLFESNTLWVGSLEGLSRIELSTAQAQTIALDDGVSAEQRLGGVYGVAADASGNIWLARDRGVSRIHSDRSVTDYPFAVSDPTRLAPYSMVVDAQSGVWLTIPYRGVFYKPANSEVFFRDINLYKTLDIRSYAIREALAVSADGRKLLLAHGNEGLFEFDIENGAQRSFTGTQTGSNQQLTSLQQLDALTFRLFYGEQSAVEVNVASGEVRDIELPIPNVGCFLEDSAGYVWLAQRKGGLYRWHQNSGEVRRFRRVEGVPADGLTGRHCRRLGDALFFPSYSGLLYIDATQSFTDNSEVTTLITAVRDGSHSNLLDRPVAGDGRQQLRFAHNQGPLAFEFAATALAQPQDSRYRYRLKGLSNDWIEVSANERTVRFQGLPADSYEFEVQGSNADGVWSSQSATVAFSTLPPWWRTWWALSLCGLLTALALFSIYILRTRALRQRGRALQAEVTARTHELAAEKQTVERLLAQRNDEFANLSHEFRTPLTLILGAAKRALSESDDGVLAERLDLIRRNGQRLSRLVDQLLLMERFRVAKAATAKPIAVHLTLALLARSFQELADDKRLQFSVDTLERVWISLTPDTLEKVALNLLSNAIKYTPEGGEIHLSAHLDPEDWLVLQVSDTGVGIAVDQQAQVFDRFQRAHDESGDATAGSGIGLALVKELVEVHDGDIQLDSVPDLGTTIVVRLPGGSRERPESDREVEAAHAERWELELESLRPAMNATPASSAKSHAPGRDDVKGLVLVVEDNRDMRAYIVETLAADGYQCLEAANGELGLSIAREHVPDLVISDVMMPHMDGFELSACLREQELTSHIPIVLLTARGDRASRLRGWSEAADEYLTKPFDEEELCLRVANLLSIRNMLRQRFNQRMLQPDVYDAKPTNRAVCRGDGPEFVAQATDVESGGDASHWAQSEQRFIERIDGVLAMMFDEPELRVGAVAKELAMSERQLHRKVKSLLNATPNEYIRAYRLKRAAKLLAEGKSAGEVAYSVGFASHAYFSKCFRAFYGRPPSEYQDAAIT